MQGCAPEDASGVFLPQDMIAKAAWCGYFQIVILINNVDSTRIHAH